MKSLVYSRWDGTQREFRLDAERALDAMSSLLMEGLDVHEALESFASTVATVEIQPNCQVRGGTRWPNDFAREDSRSGRT